MCVVVFIHVREATRVVGHYTTVVPGDSSWAGRVWEATDVGWRLVCRACGRGWGPEAWIARRLACGKDWHFKRGGYRTPRAVSSWMRPAGGSRRMQLMPNHPMSWLTGLAPTPCFGIVA